MANLLLKSIAVAAVCTSIPVEVQGVKLNLKLKKGFSDELKTLFFSSGFRMHILAEPAEALRQSPADPADRPAPPSFYTNPNSFRDEIARGFRDQKKIVVFLKDLKDGDVFAGVPTGVVESGQFWLDNDIPINMNQRDSSSTQKTEPKMKMFELDKVVAVCELTKFAKMFELD